MAKFRVAEFFTGIGSQAKALENIKADFEIAYTCEWDIHAFCAYDLIHNGTKIDDRAEVLTKEELISSLSKYVLSLDGKSPMKVQSIKSIPEDVLRLIYSSILKTNNLVNISDVKGQDLDDNLDLLTYSFPCQDLSNMGALHGHNKGIDRDSGNRSSLLWEIERILKEMIFNNQRLPKFLMLENVTSLMSPRHIANFKEWQKELEDFGYTNKIYQLMATDFGLPQTRKRLIMISTFTGFSKRKESKVKQYFDEHNLEDQKYRKTLSIKNKKLKDLLQLDYSKDYILEEALEMQPNDTKSRRDIWRDNPQIVPWKDQKIKLKAVPTLTTKQDRHPNSGNIYFDYEGNNKSKFRYLTPRECFLLMGYDNKDFEILKQNKLMSRKNTKFFCRDKMIKLAGNSIAVPVLEQVFKQILELNELL